MCFGTTIGSAGLVIGYFGGYGEGRAEQCGLWKAVFSELSEFREKISGSTINCTFFTCHA